MELDAIACSTFCSRLSAAFLDVYTHAALVGVFINSKLIKGVIAPEINRPGKYALKLVQEINYELFLLNKSSVQTTRNKTKSVPVVVNLDEEENQETSLPISTEPTETAIMIDKDDYGDDYQPTNSLPPSSELN